MGVARLNFDILSDIFWTVFRVFTTQITQIFMIILVLRMLIRHVVCVWVCVCVFLGDCVCVSVCLCVCVSRCLSQLRKIKLFVKKCTSLWKSNSFMGHPIYILFGIFASLGYQSFFRFALICMHWIILIALFDNQKENFQ